ncbi:MAG: hypothetical protein ACI9JM_003273 [Halioglobus sp.]|jgi:hypothetical protein
MSLPLRRLLRSAVNITVLFCALVLTPLFALSHFNAGLATLFGDLASDYLPNPTLLNVQKKARVDAEQKLHQQRIKKTRLESANRTKALQGSKIVNDKGRRVLVRGAGALAVGWMPFLGVTADVASLTEDYSDICELFNVLDELLGMLSLENSNLYKENYCDVPNQGILILKEAAGETNFTWNNVGKGQPLPAP